MSERKFPEKEGFPNEGSEVDPRVELAKDNHPVVTELEVVQALQQIMLRTYPWSPPTSEEDPPSDYIQA